MRSLIAIGMALALWSCGMDYQSSEMAVMDSDKELGNAFTDWHEYYFVDAICSGWDGDSNQPTTSESSNSSNSTGYSVGPGSQSAPGRIPSSQLPDGGNWGSGGGGGNLMSTVRGYNDEITIFGVCHLKKDAKEKALLAFVKSL